LHRTEIEDFFDATHGAYFSMTTAAEPAWQITPDKVQMVVHRLMEVVTQEDPTVQDHT
jgi:hypothetical protein